MQASRLSRRNVLGLGGVGVVAGLAGCSGTMAKSYPKMTVTGDSVPATREVSIHAEVNEQFTKQSPARLQIRFTNTAERTRNFLFWAIAPFGPLTSTSESAGILHIIPTDTTNNAGLYDHVIPERPIDGCWQLVDHYDFIDRGILWPAAPGAITKTNYVVLNDPENDKCLSPGEHRFEAEWGERDDENLDQWYSWEFTLMIND